MIEHDGRETGRPTHESVEMGSCLGQFQDQGELAGFVLWLLEEQQVAASEVARMIEKPWSYQDWLAVYRRHGSLDELDAVVADPDDVSDGVVIGFRRRRPHG